MKKNKMIINWEEKFENKLGLDESDYNKILSTINNEENKDNHNFKCISLDLPRTVSKEDRLKNPQFYSNLEEVLKVFCSSNGNLGYKSGMSFITKMILKLTDNNKIKTYIILKNIFENQNIKDLYNNNHKNIFDKYYLLFKEKMPTLFQHFEKNKIQSELFIISWLTSLFTFEFDENIAEYIFKIFIYKNDFDIYIYSILSILMIYENELLNKKGDEILPFCFSMKEVEFNKFIEKINNFLYNPIFVKLRYISINIRFIFT